MNGWQNLVRLDSQVSALLLDGSKKSLKLVSNRSQLLELGFHCTDEGSFLLGLVDGKRVKLFDLPQQLVSARPKRI